MTIEELKAAVREVSDAFMGRDESSLTPREVKALDRLHEAAAWTHEIAHGQGEAHEDE